MSAAGVVSTPPPDPLPQGEGENFSPLPASLATCVDAVAQREGERFWLFSASLAVVLLGAGLLAACAAPQAETNPFPPVPAAMSEVIPKPPVSATPLIWQPGHWDWNGTAYVWAPGQYVPAEGHGSMWLPGYWQKTEAGWQWQPGHWTS